MWYIEHLLLYQTMIRLTCDMESDEYNDLLIVEREIEYFKENNLFSPTELYVLDLVAQDKFYTINKKNKDLIQKVFTLVCARLGNVLGGIFTNDGYINYMQERYNLSPEQVNTLSQFITSEFRHKILRKPYEENQ